jgi:hypothetical protein
MSNFQFVTGNLVLRGIRWEASEHAPSANVDDLAISSSVVLILPSAAIDVTGFNASAFAPDLGSMLWIRNKSPTHSIALVHDSTSAAGNRIFTPSGSNYSLGAKSQAFLLYDTDHTDANPGWWVFA